MLRTRFESAGDRGLDSAVGRSAARMVTGAVFAALLSAFFFALAAVLQQREALQATASGIADPRLLWRLAHRPLWLAGIVADGLAAALHVLALSLGSIALVQPLGVTGLLLAIPMVALVRRQRIQGRDVAAAVAVLAGLVVLLRLFPAATESRVGSGSVIVAVVAGTVAVAATAVGLAQVWPGRPRALLLAAGAGISFGIVAVLVRALLAAGPGPTGVATVAIALGIGLLVAGGYLLLQNAYRAGHFAASLAMAVVIDPLAAIVGGVFVLHEPLPHAAGQAVTGVVSAAVIVAGIVMLVRSPAHLFTISETGPIPPKN